MQDGTLSQKQEGGIAMAISKRTWTKPGGEQKSAWEVAYRDQQGKRRRKQFAKKKDADAWLVNARSEVASGIHTPDSQSITIADAASIWLFACERGRGGKEPVEPSTLRAYRNHVEKHIVPYIGEDLLSQLSAPKCVSFRDSLLARLSRPMAKKVMVSLIAILNEAQARGVVAQNVAKGVGITSSGRYDKEVVIPDRSDVRVILETSDVLAQNDNPQLARRWKRYQTYLHTAAFTGMRQSELRGLYWDDVNFKSGLISICQRADENGIIGPVKSAAGRRDISIGKVVVKLLREWRMLCPPGNLVFPNWQGNVEMLSNIHRRCWQPVCQRAGIISEKGKAKFSLNSLRHFRASILIASDANPKEVQKEMGHSSIKVTFDIYGHLFPEDVANRRRRAEQIEAEIIG
jgi:integrase